MDILQKQERLPAYQTMIQEMMEIMDRKNCISDLVDCFSRHMHVLVGIIDTSFKWIAFTTEAARGAPLSESTQKQLRQGFLTDESITVLEHYASGKNIPVQIPYDLTGVQEVPVLPSHPEGLCSVLHIPVKSGGETIALMSVGSAERQLDGTDAAIGQDAARLISLILIRDGLVPAFAGDNCSALLHEIITGSLTDEQIIRLRFASLNRPLDDALFLAVLLPLKEKPDHPSWMQKMQQELSRIIPGSISTVYQDNVCFLLGSRQGTSPLSGITKSLHLFLKANHAILGISAMFRSPAQLRRHFPEARMAAQTGARMAPDRQIYPFDSATAELSVQMLSENPDVVPESFCHPAIRILYESSRPADHDLLDTLEQYLFTMKDVGRTCEALHIQRSTLYYRLNKLKDLLGEDALNDGHLVQQLMYSFTVIHVSSSSR